MATPHESPLDAARGAPAPERGPVPARERRWREEAAFFDAHAPGPDAAAQPLDPAVIARYLRPARPFHGKEFRFRLLGDLRGQHVLDVGCGAGENAILLALRGARVTGIDLSPRSIEAANRRAAATALLDPPRFVCAPLETAELPERAFDVVWGDGVLHHVLPELEPILRRLARAARPGARFVFSEPVTRLPALRRLRDRLPAHQDATPGERPLVEAELELVRRFVPDLRIRAFGLAGALVRFVLPGGYERAPLHRRLAADALCALDWAVLSAPGLERAGSMAVLYGRLPG